MGVPQKDHGSAKKAVERRLVSLNHRGVPGAVTERANTIGTVVGTVWQNEKPPCQRKSLILPGLVAVTEGFEPSVQLYTVQRFSKPPPSAARPRHPLGDGRA